MLAPLQQQLTKGSRVPVRGDLARARFAFNLDAQSASVMVDGHEEGFRWETYLL